NVGAVGLDLVDAGQHDCLRTVLHLDDVRVLPRGEAVGSTDHRLAGVAHRRRYRLRIARKIQVGPGQGNGARCVLPLDDGGTIERGSVRGAFIYGPQIALVVTRAEDDRRRAIAGRDARVGEHATTVPGPAAALHRDRSRRPVDAEIRPLGVRRLLL